MSVIQFKKPGVNIPDRSAANDATVNKLKDAAGRFSAAGVLVFFGVLNGFRLALFMVLLWLKPVVTGASNFLCAVLLIAAGVFYFLPRFNEHWVAVLIASFICFLVSFTYETIIFKLAGDDAVRLY